MKVLALRADKGGCANYRIENPSKVLHKMYGVNVKVSSSIGVEAVRDPATGVYTVREIKEDVDLLVIQRPLNNYGVALITQAKKQGIATIVELDDDFETVHPDNTAWKDMQPEHSPEANHVWLRKATEMCDLVTVSTDALTKYSSHLGGVVVLPNYVPESIFDLKKTTYAPRPIKQIGWSGTVSTHPNDIPTVGNSVRNVLSQTGGLFFVVGDPTGVAQQLRISRQQIRSTGIVPLHLYYQSLIDNIDIGIVPLEKSDFNEAKSYLKMLEMSALGIPTVASPTAQNIELHALGVGIIAETPLEWRKHLLSLMRSGPRYSSISSSGVDIIREKLTYETNAWRWFEAWSKAISIRKSDIQV